MGRLWREGRGDAGQASVEWVGIVLVAALALGGLAAAVSARAGRSPARDRDLGELVASRLVCAARGSCVGAAATRPVAPPRVAPVPGRGADRARAVAALRRLRSVGAKVVRRAWLVCIGYRRFRYELEHPRAPTEPMPLDEAIEIANGCLNPYAFLVEDE